MSIGEANFRADWRPTRIVLWLDFEAVLGHPFDLREDDPIFISTASFG
jgi:hypothetical protein